MKITDFVKFFTVVTACLTVGSAVGAATYNCNAQKIPKTFWDLNRDKNQFLYSNKANQTAHYGWACGHKDINGCKTDVLLLMPNGHYWRDDARNDIQFYRCNSVGMGSAWEELGPSGGGYISQCTASQMRSWKNNHVGFGMNHYFCKKMVDKVCVDETRTSNSAQSNGICRATDDQYRCIDNNGTWSDSLNSCQCLGGKVWNGSRCEEDKDAARREKEQKCLNYGGRMVGDQCMCPENEWLDTSATPPHCKSKNECPTGSQCNYGTIINLQDIGNPSVNVNTAQQNQQVTEVGQEQTQGQTSENSNRNNNSSESNSSNTNNNNSNNGNTTVNGDGNNVNTGNGGNGGGGSSLQNCLNDPRRKGNQELLACCYLNESGAAGGNPNFATGKCVCNDGSKKFSIAANGRGQCIGNGGNGGGGGGDSTPQCSDRMYYNATEKRCMCSAENQTEINNNTACKCAIAGATNDANGNCKCDDPKKVIVDGQCVYANTQCPNSNMQFNTSNGECECTGAYQRKVVKNGVETCECTVPGAKNDAYGVCKCNEEGKVVDANGKCSYDENAIVNIRARITELYGKLNSKMGGFEKNVWKDAEGNFNTARLASDSIAGVVLGTAGGIITSKLVKKNQLKTGFEDIKCAIGGQNVASYGDSFSVGM